MVSYPPPDLPDGPWQPVAGGWTGALAEISDARQVDTLTAWLVLGTLTRAGLLRTRDGRLEELTAPGCAGRIASIARDLTL